MNSFSSPAWNENEVIALFEKDPATGSVAYPLRANNRKYRLARFQDLEYLTAGYAKIAQVRTPAGPRAPRPTQPLALHSPSSYTPRPARPARAPPLLLLTSRPALVVVHVAPPRPRLLLRRLPFIASTLLSSPSASPRPAPVFYCAVFSLSPPPCSRLLPHRPALVLFFPCLSLSSA